MLRQSISKWLVIVLFATLVAIPILVYVSPVHADAATIWTDKQDYTPEETVTISGSGFAPDAPVTLTILRPDGATDTLSAMADNTGAFSTTYQLDGIMGIYAVTASDGTNTATTTFTDKVYVTYVLEGLTLTPSVTMRENWVQGWNEGQWVPFRLTITNTGPATTVSITEQLDYNKVADYGIDAFASCFIISASPYCGSGATPASGTVWKVLVGATETTPSVTTALVGGTTVIQWTLSGSSSVSLPAGSDSSPSTVEVKWAVHLAVGGSANLVCSDPLSPLFGCTPAAIPSGNGAHQFTTDYSNIGVKLSDPSRSVNIQSVGAVVSPSSISGLKFEDVYADHVKNDGDTGLAGWTIKLDGKDINGGTVSLTTTTADGTGVPPLGAYSFTNLLPSDSNGYDVCEDLSTHPGWIKTLPATSCYNVVISSGGTTVTGKDFGNFELGTISGVKFEDLNANGAKNDGEPGLNGWTITIEGTDTLTGEEVDTSTVTATVDSVDGFYSFTGLTPGAYTVCEEPKTDWIQTAPGSACYIVEISTSGQNEVDKNFGNVHVFSRVTDSSFCVFDVDSRAEGQQFRLIFTPYLGSFKLPASNPGQFYDNVVFYGNPGDAFTLTISVPYPFVTQGAVPVHVYDGFLETTNALDCVSPGTGTDVTSTFTISGAPISLTDWNGGTFGDTKDITVAGNLPSSGVVYVTIHLDYGLKGTNGWAKSDTTATCPSGPCPSGVNIPDAQGYDFDFDLTVGEASLPTELQTVQSENVFKKDPGFAGLVTDQYGNPVVGVQVQIYAPTGKLLGTVYTDQDGWYMYQYKYTGKAATFTVTLPACGQSKPALLKSNSVVQVDFQV